MRYSEGVPQRILKKLQDAVASEELLLEFVQVGPSSEAAERQPPPPPSAASRKRMSRQGDMHVNAKKLACQQNKKCLFLYTCNSIYTIKEQNMMGTTTQTLCPLRAMMCAYIVG